MRPAAAVLLFLAAAPVGAASWPRARSGALRAGTVTGAEPACRELRPYARRLRWDLPASKDNPVNCGAGGGRSSSYVLA
ncbi:MAG: hypothetical protein KGL53_02630, partial [Elusimicrobia bacterium]|nr:hypothetical protein [Elusimicrobiota bacterium]